MWIFNTDSFYGPVLRRRRCEIPALDGEAASGGARPADPRRVSIRTRRRLVSSLRRVANHRPPRNAAQRRFEVILHDRVSPVREELLEIAGLLERVPEPDPGCVTALRALLTNGCESPLYNRDVHPSELLATLYYVRSRLATVAPVAGVGR